MKKILLFTAIIAVLISSCSKEEEYMDQVSQEEKELLVKEMIIEINNGVKTGKFKKLKNSSNQKSSAENLSTAEREALFEEFLGEQSQALLDLYLELKAINMTGEEFNSIAYQYEYLLVGINKSSSNCGSGLECAIEAFIKSATREIANSHDSNLTQ